MEETLPRVAFVAGATSSLAYALCQELAQRGWRLVLCGRDVEEMEKLATDIAVRFGGQSKVLEADFLDPACDMDGLIIEVEEEMGPITHGFMLVGDMGDARHQGQLANIEQVMRVTATAPMKWVSALAAVMRRRNVGDIVVVSSVAGDRGRASNYVYGSAKAALSTFAAGLRHRMQGTDVHVMTVKPGFVDTPLTYGMKSKLIADRGKVAHAIIEAMKARKNVVYVPFFWRWIMLIIQHIPEWLFKRTRL